MIREFKIGDSIKSNLGDLYKEIKYVSSMGEGMSHGCITFYDPEFHMLSTALLSRGSKFSFRWGPTEEAATPWQNYIVYNVEVKYMPRGGAEVYVYICDHSVRLLLDSAFHTYNDSRFSDVVEEIAESYELPDPIVEPSLIRKDWYQCGEKDWNFMIGEVSRQVTEGDRQGDYRLFFKHGNELHFHPPDFEQDFYRTLSVQGRTVTENFRLRSMPFEAAVAGGEAVTVHGYDRGKIESLESTQGRGNIEEQGLTVLAKRELSRLTEVGRNPRSFTGRYKYDSSDDPDEVEAIARAVFQKNFNQSYWAEMKVHSDSKIQPGNLVYVSTPVKGNPLAGEGLWLVEMIEHTVPRSQEGETKILMSRSLTNLGGEALNVKKNQQAELAEGRTSPTEGEHASNFLSQNSRSKSAQLL